MLRLYYLTIHLMTWAINGMPLQHPLQTSFRVEIAPVAFESSYYRAYDLDTDPMLECLAEGMYMIAALKQRGWNVVATCSTESSQLRAPFANHYSAPTNALAESDVTVVSRALALASILHRYN